MRKTGIYLLVVLTSALGMNCGSDDPATPETSTLFMYKVDYSTNELEGGITLAFDKVPPPLFSEIPLDVDREEPTQDSDGGIAIIYRPTLDILFNGSLTNSGTPNILFPTFIAPSEFLFNDQPVALPTTPIQSIEGDHSQVNLAPIWAAVSNLALTEFALQENTRIGLYLYQPNPDPAFSANWDWMIILYNQ